MELYGIARQQIEQSMTNQFRETPETEGHARRAPRPGIVTTLRLRLSADLRALAAAIEPHRPLSPPTGAPQR
jgi:hypothetical protein